MSSNAHGSDMTLRERLEERGGSGGSVLVLGNAPVGGNLLEVFSSHSVIRCRWRDDLEATLRRRQHLDVIVVDATEALLHERRAYVRENRRFWRRANVIVVEHAGDPFGHGIALEIAELVSGEITIDRSRGADPFAWIEVPAASPRPAAIERADTPGVLPEGMQPREPVGLANDWSWIADRVTHGSMPDLRISVVIPLYNRRDFLARTLACLLHQTFPRNRFEVVVADDGSSDDPLDVIEGFGALDITYVRQADEGYRLSEVRNLGIRTASYDHIVLLDCDMAPVPQMLELYARWLAASSDGLYLGHRRYVDANHLRGDDLLTSAAPILGLPDIVTSNPLETEILGRPTVDWRIPLYQATDDLRTEPHPFRMVCGGNVAFHRDLFERAGEFDENFTAWGAEDAEWGFRVWNRGHYIVPVLGACGLHQEPVGGRNETDREAGRQETHPMFVDRCPEPYRKIHDDGAVHQVPLVSIYIPAYNAEATIVRAVQSALDQSITDLEVCVVDDGSTDRTAEVLAEVFGDNPRVRWKSQSNGGIGAASNAAVRMCRGAYIGQLDADDRLKPNAVRVLLRALRHDTRYGLAYSRFEHINASGERVRAGRHHPQFTREAMLHSMIVHPFRLFRARDWWRTAGFDESIRNAVDYDMYLKLSEVTEPIHVDRVLYEYRLTGASTSKRHRAEQVRNHRRVIEAALERQGLSEHWRLADPDAGKPGQVEFASTTAAPEPAEPLGAVSSEVVIDLDAGDSERCLELLRHRFPSWTWSSEPAKVATDRILVGPRLRTEAAGLLRPEVELAVSPVAGASVRLRDNDPPRLWSAAERQVPADGWVLGGGTYAPPADPDARLVLGVTTLGRREYLEHFLTSFNETRSDRYHWTVVVADDGSIDETLPWLRNEAVVAADLIVVENKGQTVSGQTNSIFNAALATDFDLGFKCDDDIWFQKPGWDVEYVDAVRSSGRGHLVFHSTSYKPPTHRIEDGALVSSVAAPDCMGCFYTFTRDVLESTGYLDEASFPIRGHAHIDFTMRASRLGHNVIETLWDARRGDEFIDLWTGPDYQQTFDWGSGAARALIDEDEVARRWSVVHNDTRTHIPERPDDLLRPDSRIRTSPGSLAAGERLAGHRRMRLPGRIDGEIDAAFVLNMPGDTEDFAITHEMARRHGLAVQRFPGVVGSEPEVTAEWRAYADQGFTHPLESKIGRKLIASPGAWAYLSGLRNLIEHARDARMKRIVVFDDDVMLANDFGSRFPSFLDALPEQWVLALLGSTPQGDARFSQVTSSLCRVDAEFNGSYAFAVDAAAYELLLHEIDQRVWPFDSGPLRTVADAFPEDVWAPAETLAIADVSTSNIRGGRKHRQFWREMGQRPGRYEQRSFTADGPHSEGSTARDRRVSFITEPTESAEHTLATVNALLDQTNGNLAVFVRCALDAPTRPMLERRSVQDPRLVIVSERVDDDAAQEPIGGQSVAIVDAGALLADDVAERMAAGETVVEGAAVVSAETWEMIGTDWADLTELRQRLR